jgi:paraquat-inducible protein B
MNMICAAVGIPYSYFGFQDASGQTRASALVATEPVAKKFQKRQQFFERIILDMTEELMRRFNIKGAKFEVTFPELITQDRSSKIKDLMAIEQAGYLSKERVAQIIAKEFGVTDFNFQKEQEEITKQIDTTPVEPLTSLPRQPLDSSSALTSDERKDIASNGSTL